MCLSWQWALPLCGSLISPHSLLSVVPFRLGETGTSLRCQLCSRWGRTRSIVLIVVITLWQRWRGEAAFVSGRFPQCIDTVILCLVTSFELNRPGTFAAVVFAERGHRKYHGGILCTYVSLHPDVALYQKYLPLLLYFLLLLCPRALNS